jgi:hypothetical protein
MKKTRCRWSTPEGTLSAVQLEPVSAVERITPVARPVVGSTSSPTTQPLVGLTKKTPFKSLTTVASGCLSQVAPPSLVHRMVAPAGPDVAESPPTAQPVVALAK